MSEKKGISPAVAVVVIIVVLAIIAGLYVYFLRPKKPPKEFTPAEMMKKFRAGGKAGPTPPAAPKGAPFKGAPMPGPGPGPTPPKGP